MVVERKELLENNFWLLDTQLRHSYLSEGQSALQHFSHDFRALTVDERHYLAEENNKILSRISTGGIALDAITNYSHSLICIKSDNWILHNNDNKDLIVVMQYAIQNKMKYYNDTLIGRIKKLFLMIFNLWDFGRTPSIKRAEILRDEAVRDLQVNEEPRKNKDKSVHFFHNNRKLDEECFVNDRLEQDVEFAGLLKKEGLIELKDIVAIYSDDDNKSEERCELYQRTMWKY